MKIGCPIQTLGGLDDFLKSSSLGQNSIFVLDLVSFFSCQRIWIETLDLSMKCLCVEKTDRLTREVEA